VHPAARTEWFSHSHLDGDFAMDFDARHYTGFLVIASGVVIVAMSYLAAYMVGKNAGRKEAERRLDR
jgi:hypothetical protein